MAVFSDFKGKKKSYLFNINKKNIDVDWLLAGGLTEKNVHRAVNITNTIGVDVSSGVEIVKGKKSPKLIKNFVRMCRNI